jgi:hypothetical protein
LNESLLFIRRQIAGSLSGGFANPNRNGGGSKASPINFTCRHADVIAPL